MTEQCVILNDIHIDIMDYIKPAYCTEAQVSADLDELEFVAERSYQFRSMWTEFEWENRVNVTTTVTYTNHPFFNQIPLWN